MQGRTQYSSKKVEDFLFHLRETGGNVSRSAERIGVGRQTVYDWKAQHSDFSDLWDEALESSTEDLEEEAKRRAYAGTEEPVFYQGEVCGTIKKYSDTLLIFLLKAHRPAKYREQLKIVSTTEVDQTIEQAIKEHRLPDGTTVLDSTM